MKYMYCLSSVIIFLSVGLLYPDSRCNAESASARGAYYSGEYPNLFSEILNVSRDSLDTKINTAFQQLYYGDNQQERIYYPVGDDMAYMIDVVHNDVRSEGMSYGMMIAVQMDKQKEFDCLWKWAKTYMQHQTPERKSYFAWQCSTDGAQLDKNSASDGEIWFVTSLFLAAARWGNGDGIYNYQSEAQAILDAMLNKVESSNSTQVVTNMFNRQEQQMVFVPVGNADDFTDPSYHTPHYFELWARWADKENDFWCKTAKASRGFLKNAVHPVTGLAPDYANFDGTAIDAPWGGGHDNFQYDAWRVAMNVALDYIWFAKDDWAVSQSNRLLKFFHGQGTREYVGLYTLDGGPLSDTHNAGLVAMNAVAALASDIDIRKEFVQELWNMPVPSGIGRYYDGLLYMMAMLQVGGQFQVYELTDGPIDACQ